MFLIKDEKIRNFFHAAISTLPSGTKEKAESSGLVHEEEVKEEQEPSAGEEGVQTEQVATIVMQGMIDFKSMQTQELFNVAIPVFETIIERVNARASAINCRITQLLGQHIYKPNFQRRL